MEFPSERSREAKKLYRKIPISPAKITVRYSFIKFTSSSGVRRNQMIQSMPKAKIRILSTIVTTQEE